MTANARITLSVRRRSLRSKARQPTATACARITRSAPLARTSASLLAHTLTVHARRTRSARACNIKLLRAPVIPTASARATASAVLLNLNRKHRPRPVIACAPTIPCVHSRNGRHVLLERILIVHALPTLCARAMSSNPVRVIPTTIGHAQLTSRARQARMRPALPGASPIVCAKIAHLATTVRVLALPRRRAPHTTTNPLLARAPANSATTYAVLARSTLRVVASALALV